MPVVNYEERAERDKAKLFQNNNISDINKELVKEFLNIYDVSNARKGIFFRQITKPLEYFSDISLLLDENNKTLEAKKEIRKQVNTFFKTLKTELSPSYYNTIISVTNRLLTWLNDDVKPYACKDIKKLKEGVKRDLSPSDMITREDCALITANARTTQMKAIINTMLDGGFRPSEFIDLNYGDITPAKDGFMNAHIKKGKTGSRDVALYRCVPYLQAWLSQHPTKKANDPLWTVEIVHKSHKKVKNETIPRYSIAGIRSRITSIARRINIHKPLDFYNLRHSACTISKLENDPADFASERFGHSLDFYTNTYGRLAGSDMIKRYKNHLEDVNDDKKNLNCSICNTSNAQQATHCIKCSNPLTLEEALKYKQSSEEQNKRIEELEKALFNLTKSLLSKDLKT